MQKYLQQSLNEEVSYWINHNLNNYLKKNEENQSEIEHIIDYLNSEQAPKRLKKMSYKEANQSAQRWLKTLVKQGANIEEVEDVDYDIVIDFKDGYKLIKLKSELSFKREGSLMGHCVGSYFNRNGTSIYSLRDSRNMPHATLELPDDSSSMNQVKGKGNGPIHVKYIKYILDTLKHFKVDVRDSEMIYLGYQRLEDVCNRDQADWFNNRYTYSTINLGKKVYIYLDSVKRKK